MKYAIIANDGRIRQPSCCVISELGKYLGRFGNGKVKRDHHIHVVQKP